MSNRNAAEILVQGGAYVNAVRNGEAAIELPDGSTVPVYLSCRRLISRPLERAEIESQLVEQVRNQFPSADLIVGLATAGIPWAHAVASELELPLAYVRSQTKGYGMGRLVEGDPAGQSNAVIIDDVLFTGASVFRAIDALTLEKNINIIGAASIASLNGEGVEAYRRSGLAAIALTNYQQILDSAVMHDILSAEEAVDMQRYYENSGLSQ